MADKTEIDAALATTLAGQTLHTTGRTVVVVPDGYTLEDLEAMQPQPSRLRGTVVVRSVDAFNRFYNEMKESGSQVRIYGDIINPQFTAVFNDDAPHAPGW